MKIKTFLLLFISTTIAAQNLNEILQALEASKQVVFMKEQKKSQIVQTQLLDSYDAPYLGLSISHADESDKDGQEYGVGISQDISHPFADKKIAVDAKLQAIELASSYALNTLTIDVVKTYHQACISKQMSLSLQNIYDEQSSSYTKLQRAYELGEISKKELLFNKLDLVQTKRSIQTYKRAYMSELVSLTQAVNGLQIKDLECDDLQKITKDIELKDIDEHRLLKEIAKQQSFTKAFYDVYNSTFSSISYELLYEKELDKSRYTFALNLPLDFLSSKATKQRAEFFHKDAALVAKKDALTKEIQDSLELQKEKLKTLYDEFVLLNEEILPMSLELKDLAKKSLLEGHSSVLEYLDATRSYSKTLLEFQGIKKDYYNELFEIYKKADMRSKL